MSAPAAPDGTPHPRRTNTGFGRVLVAVYGIFALAASARAAVQLLRERSAKAHSAATGRMKRVVTR